MDTQAEALRQSKAPGRKEADSILCGFSTSLIWGVLLHLLRGWAGGIGFVVFFLTWEMKEANIVLEQCKSLEL